MVHAKEEFAIIKQECGNVLFFFLFFEGISQEADLLHKQSSGEQMWLLKRKQALWARII